MCFLRRERAGAPEAPCLCLLLTMCFMVVSASRVIYSGCMQQSLHAGGWQAVGHSFGRRNVHACSAVSCHTLNSRAPGGQLSCHTLNSRAPGGQLLQKSEQLAVCGAPGAAMSAAVPVCWSCNIERAASLVGHQSWTWCQARAAGAAGASRCATTALHACKQLSTRWKQSKWCAGPWLRRVASVEVS
ncbi:hypothetical protein COO60DRAFT_530826 [Scenedesmus sp. NREL 46B-D3]|nr:hypothetical protein COO60DRAFT_530826 [Scenedesmus sp. NREL 46B-D3]